MNAALTIRGHETDVSAETRTRILVEAERLFRHYGYGKTTVADIAKALGMSPANVYRFFSSKAAIHEALCTRLLSDREEMLEQIARGPGTAAERIRRIVAADHTSTIETFVEEGRVHEMVVVAMEENWTSIKAHLDRVVGFMADVIREGIDAGEFRPQDPIRAARCVKAAAVTLCHPMVCAQCVADSDRATVDELADFIVHALRA